MSWALEITGSPERATAELTTEILRGVETWGTPTTKKRAKLVIEAISNSISAYAEYDKVKVNCNGHISSNDVAETYMNIQIIPIVEPVTA